MADSTPTSQSVQTFTEVQASLNPTVEQTLKTLDFEINRITEAHKRPGWTVWALCGSIVSAIWLITDQWLPEKTNIVSVLYLFLLFSLIYDFITITRSIIPITASKPDRTYTVIPLFDLVPPQIYLLTALHAAILLSIALLMRGTLGVLLTTIIIFIYTIILLVNGYIFIASFFQNFVYVSSRAGIGNKKLKIAIYSFRIGYSILLLWICSRLIDYALSQYNESITLSDVRIAGLLVIISVLVSWLAAHNSSDPLLGSLINIRRDLAFGRITVDVAISQADIAITGMKFDRFMRDKLDEWLKYLERATALKQQLVAAFEQIQDELPDKDEDITADHKKRAEEILTPMKDEIMYFMQYKEYMAKTIRSVERRAEFFAGLSNETEQLSTDIISKINKSRSEQIIDVENYFNKLFAVLKRLLRDKPEEYEAARLKAEKMLAKAKKRVKSIDTFK